MERLKTIHDELLQAVAQEQHRFPGKELTTFFPIQGRESTGELMVVGRAVNGWSETKWTASEASDAVRRAEIIREVVATSTRTDCCPMDWVREMWSHGIRGKWEARRSAFFRLSRAVSESLPGPSDNWPSRLIFSNLYKVAPYKGKNPGSRLCAAQQQACEAHLIAEIEMWKPKRILFVTGWDWARPFVERFGEIIGERSTEYVEWTGVARHLCLSHEIRLVVSVRPEARQQVPLTDAILRSFSIPIPEDLQSIPSCSNSVGTTPSSGKPAP
jgi:hypothetical protein